MASTLTFELRRVDGTPADPPSFQTVAPLWRPGDTIALGRRPLRVIGVRHGDDADKTTVLIVEDGVHMRDAGGDEPPSDG